MGSPPSPFFGVGRFQTFSTAISVSAFELIHSLHIFDQFASLPVSGNMVLDNLPIAEVYIWEGGERGLYYRRGYPLGTPGNKTHPTLVNNHLAMTIKPRLNDRLGKGGGGFFGAPLVFCWCVQQGDSGENVAVSAGVAWLGAANSSCGTCSFEDFSWSALHRIYYHATSLKYPSHSSLYSSYSQSLTACLKKANLMHVDGFCDV